MVNYHIKSRNYYIKLFGFKAQFVFGRKWDEKRPWKRRFLHRHDQM